MDYRKLTRDESALNLFYFLLLFVEDVETNESDLSKISRKIKEQKKKLQILLAKHRKRKQQIEKNKNKNRKDKHSHDDDDDGDDVNDDIISQQTGETNVSLQDFKILWTSSITWLVIVDYDIGCIVFRFIDWHEFSAWLGSV